MTAVTHRQSHPHTKNNFDRHGSYERVGGSDAYIGRPNAATNIIIRCPYPLNRPQVLAAQAQAEVRAHRSAASFIRRPPPRFTRFANWTAAFCISCSGRDKLRTSDMPPTSSNRRLAAIWAFYNDANVVVSNYRKAALQELQ